MKEFHGEYKGEALVTVNSTNTAAAVGSGSLPVYATPMMLALMAVSYTHLDVYKRQVISSA